MEFIVRFSAKSGYAAKGVSRQEFGLKHLQEARDQLSLDFNHSLLKTSLSSLTSDPIVILTEEQARESGHFEETETLNVIVPESSLNGLVSIRYGSKLNDDGESLKEVYPYYEINKEPLFDIWKASGFALEIKEIKK